MKKRRNQTLGEEIGNAVTHGVGCIFSIVAIVLMYIKATKANEYIGVTLFGLGMILLYLMSCLYHSFKNDSKVKRVFKRFDHLAIYILIGGTFAPILLCLVSHPWGLIFFIVQWILIIFGIVFKAVNANKYPYVHLACFLLLGWSALIIIPDLLKYGNEFLGLVLAGGLAYSAGVFFYTAKFKYAHFIWHFFCLFGTIFFFIAIYGYVL